MDFENQVPNDCNDLGDDKLKEILYMMKAWNPINADMTLDQIRSVT